jgi:hypothetical protein
MTESNHTEVQQELFEPELFQRAGRRDMHDWNPIELVPAVRRLGLSRVGCGDELELEFLPGLNVITEIGSARGKSTILRSILQALRPMGGFLCPLTPPEGAAEGRIAVEFLYPSISQRLVTADVPTAPEGDAASMGQRMLETLRTHLRLCQVGMGLLIDADITSPLDAPGYREAVQLLNEATCQVICVIGAQRFDPGDFPAARVFACTRGSRDTAGMEILQTGGVTDGGQ